MSLLAATIRETKTKGEVKSLRSKGMVPGIIYGGEEPNQKISVSVKDCLLYTSPSPRDRQKSRMPSSA